MNNTETLKEELKDCPWCKGKPANEKSFVSKAEMQAQQEVEPSDNTPQVSVSDIMEVLMDARIISSPYADTARAIKQLYEGKK